MKKLIILVVFILIGVVGYSYAGTEGGMKEIQVQGSFSSQTNSLDEDKTDTATGQVTLNYFFSAYFSLGGTARMSGSKTDYENPSTDDSESTTSFLLVRADLYLGGGESSFVPFIGVHGGQASYSYQSGSYTSSSSIEAYGAHGGFKVFPTENTSWNIEADITEYEPETQGSTKPYTITNTSLFIGFSYYF